MNITATLPNTPEYQVSYPTKNKWQLLVACAWTFTCTLNLIKTYKHHLRGDAFNWVDIIWMICLPIYALMIVDALISKKTFNITNGQFTLTRQSLFQKKLTVYETEQMQHIQLEERPFKKIVWFRSKPAIDYAIRFSYYEDERRLTGLPDKVQAEQLLDAIVAARR